MPAGSSWEPVPAYSNLCDSFREANNSRDCTWNIITTVWEARGMKAYGGNGTNQLIIRVDHRGIKEDSKTFERAINTVANRVYKREFTGQPYDFFSTSIIISCSNKKLIGEQYIGQVQLGVMDVFLSKDHMLPMQWFPIVDPKSDLPSEPLGYLKLNCIINNLDESGAVQEKAPDAVADWELNRHEILQIPRMNMRKVACHQYNLKFMTFQGFDLGTGEQGTADPIFRVTTPCGVIATDAFPNSLKPQWNTMLQIPYYEPTFCDLIHCEVWDGNSKRLSGLIFSWKDIFINQEDYGRPRWIDMYERKTGVVQEHLLNKEIPFAGTTVGNALEQNVGFNQSKGFFEERSVYCGRVLLAIEVEPREFKKEPSPANIALKPKDCADMWSDARQKMFFRFHCFYGQSFSVDQWKSRVQVEFQVGRKRVLTKPVQIKDGLYQFFQSVELEMELPMDDRRDNPDGYGMPSLGSGFWDPQCFVSRMPDIWVKVYKVSAVGMVLSDAEMIGFWKGDVRTVLGGGDPELWSDNCYIGTDDDNQTNKKFKGIQPIVIALGDEAPAPTKRAPWGREGDEPTLEILNPYQGYQYVMLHSDISCSLGPTDPAGFIGFSAKLWMPTRYKCANGPPKGPPVLSPWTAWNQHPIVPPWDDLLKWTRFFNIKAHIYQAKGLGAKNETGVANAYVELIYLTTPPGTQRTHTAFLTNNPTFDTTLMLNDQELYLLPDNFMIGAEEFIPDAEDFTDVKKNWKMLSLAPRFEIRVWEESDGKTTLLGRTYVDPATILPRKTNPEFIELFRGNPEIEEGHLLCSFQLIETSEKISKEPPAPLVPDKSKVNMDDEDSWCSKAPIRRVDMFESKIQIQVLGLRDLSSPHPFGWPIANPQIEICCDDPKTAQTTKSANRPSGTDANFMECVEIDVRMPVEKRFAPYLDFYVYDHSTLGMQFEMPSLGGETRPPIVAYGSMATEDFYPTDKGDDSDGEGGDGEVDENDEAAKKKAKEREQKKKFGVMVKELKKDGAISQKELNMLQKLFMKKDEAVVRAFEQYIDAPNAMKFIERVESFFGEKTGKLDNDEKDKKKKEKEEREKEKAEKKAAAAAAKAIQNGEQGDAGPDGTRPVSKDSTVRPVSKDSAAGGVAPSSASGGDEPEPEGAGAEPNEGEGGLDEADQPDGDDDEEGDEQDDGEEDAEDIVEGHAVDGEDDLLPDMQEKVDTPDGRPNAEWLLLRAHPLYNCPLEHSTVKEYGKKGAWEPRFADAFDELVLFRGPIHNFKQMDHESVGILKCKVKLFRKEDEAVAESRGEDPRFLDMAELKEGKEVAYEVPDVNENFQSRDIEIRVYLLKAFQMTPSQVIDGLAKSDNFIKISLGKESWDWRTYYDPVVALNPHFYRCAKISAKLPGPSQMHIALMDEQSNLMSMAGLANDFEEIGETIVDLEDRWFCEEWAIKTVNKPRETRDLFNPNKPGISVGKMMVMVDAVLRVDADDKHEKDVNIAGRQMPLEMRLIIWNLRNCAPKDGYTSDVKVFAELLGWGRMKETDCDCGVKVSRHAMFNYRIKFKGLKFPSPDPTIPAKDYILNLQVWGARLLGNDTLIAEGLLPLQPIFQDCMQRNLGKPSPDDMEIVSLEPAKPGDIQADEEGTKYPFKWYPLCHPGGPGCKTNKDFKQPGYDFVKNRQAEIQLTVQVMPRAKARAMPASLGFKPGPAKLFDPDRPPQPKNPIFDPEGCKAYIVYVCKEAINRKKPCCCCLSCCIILIALLVVYVYLLQAGVAPKIPLGF